MARELDEGIDLGSRLDVTSRMSVRQARKVLSEILRNKPGYISYSRHALMQMEKRELITGDIFNVLAVGNIYREPEFEHGSWRYHVETMNITVVIAFRKPNHLVVVTAWRK